MTDALKQTIIECFQKELECFLTKEQVERTIDVFMTNIDKCIAEEQERQYDMNIDLFDAFLSAKRVEGKSEGTIARYDYIVKKLLKYTKIPIDKITVYHIRQYFSAEKSRGVQDSTLDGERSIFSSLFNWLYKEGLIERNPCLNLSKIKHKKVVRKPLSNVELTQLQENCFNQRDSAIMRFMLATGCRISEVCSLNRNSINLEKREGVVLGKGNKERIIYFDDVTALLLRRYLDSRKDNLEPLFLSRINTRLKPGSIRRNLSKLAHLAGVEKVHPHRFRKTMATNLIDHGMSIQEVAHLLGHEKLDTTMSYVYIEENNVKNNYQRYL